MRPSPKPSLLTRRGFLGRATIATAGLAVAPGLAPAAARRKPRLTDEQILAECQARIARHRLGDGALVLRDARGQPVTRATVTVEQIRHEFRFGCNFFMFERFGNPEHEAASRERFAGLFNFATLGFYWRNYERERGRPNYQYTDRVVVWCQPRGIVCKGHPLAWDHPAGSPDWLPEDFAEIAHLSLGRVREIVQHYQGRIEVWDVVNEAVHLPNQANSTRMARWGAALGPEEFVCQHLRAARVANPDATLLVNDYRTDPPFLRLLEAVQARDRRLFDAVGIQSHMHDGCWPLARVWELCDQYAVLGKPLHFTEVTLVSGPRMGPGENWGATTPEGEAQQAEATAQFYTALFAHPVVEAITWWDFTDRGAWQRAPAGWLRTDLSPKPVYERMRGLLRGEWWTRFTGQPNALGVVPLRAVYGTHRVTITLPSGWQCVREVRWQRERPNRIELVVA